MKFAIAVSALTALVLIPAFLLAETHVCPAVNYPLMTGDEEVEALVVYPPYHLPPSLDNRDIVGDTVVIGTTWYENQHNGTIGRMLEKDEFGYVHFAWMNGLDYQAANRQIYYNYIDPTGVQGSPGIGFQVYSSQRAGYTTLDVHYGGLAFPSYHWTNIPGGDFWTVVAVDISPHLGFFILFEAPDHPDPTLTEIIWPKIQFDRNGVIHLACTENPSW